MHPRKTAARSRVPYQHGEGGGREPGRRPRSGFRWDPATPGAGAARGRDEGRIAACEAEGGKHILQEGRWRAETELNGTGYQMPGIV